MGSDFDDDDNFICFYHMILACLLDALIKGCRHNKPLRLLFGDVHIAFGEKLHNRGLYVIAVYCISPTKVPFGYMDKDYNLYS